MKHQILLIFTAFILSACSFVNEPYEACPSDNPGESITLSFQMTTSGAVTRTDTDISHDEQDSEFRQLEDGIDFSDFGMFVFARLSSDNESDEKLIFKNTDIMSPANKDIHVVGSPDAYTISMTILRKQLHDVLFGEDSEQEIDPNGTEMITFRILILANSTTSGAEEEGKWSDITGTTFSEVISQLDEWHYNMDNLYNSEYTGDDIEGLYSNIKENIPMFGTNVFQASQEALFYSRPEDRVYLGEIDLLRALAKVRVVDNIENKDDDGYPMITKVVFISSQNEARQLPNEASKYKNGYQVHTPNLFNDKILSLEDAKSYRLGVMPEDMTTVPAKDRKGAVLVGFVPEQTIGYVNNNVEGQGMPGFSVTVEFYPGYERDFVVPMTGYNDQKFAFGSSILRNHIYTLSVQRVDNEADITMVAIEAPYNSVSLNPGFGELFDPEVTEE